MGATRTSHTTGSRGPQTSHDALDEEITHLRAALKLIQKVCLGNTPGSPVDDLAVICNVAGQGLTGRALEGDPAVYDLKDVRT